MKAQVLTGSKEEILENLARIDGDVREAIVFVQEPSDAASPENDILAEMEPYMVSVGTSVDCSREALYTRMEGE